jgi:hypothetical protein
VAANIVRFSVLGERLRAVETARDAALADNADHVRLFNGVKVRTSCDDTAEVVTQHLAQPHPGAALLEDLKFYKGAADALGSVRVAIGDSVPFTSRGVPGMVADLLERMKTLEEALDASSRERDRALQDLRDLQRFGH